MYKLLFREHLQEQHSDSIHIYTDASKTRDGTSFAAVFPTEYTSRKICKDASIFTAEVYAIMAALKRINKDRNYTIITDSRSVLQAIDVLNSNHPLVSKMQQCLTLLASRNKVVQLCWAPSDSNIAGNEAADSEAREAVQTLQVDDTKLVAHSDYYPQIKRKLRNKWQGM